MWHMYLCVVFIMGAACKTRRVQLIPKQEITNCVLSRDFSSHQLLVLVTFDGYWHFFKTFKSVNICVGDEGEGRGEAKKEDEHIRYQELVEFCCITHLFT